MGMGMGMAFGVGIHICWGSYYQRTTEERLLRRDEINRYPTSLTLSSIPSYTSL